MLQWLYHQLGCFLRLERKVVHFYSGKPGVTGGGFTEDGRPYTYTIPEVRPRKWVTYERV